MENLSGAALGGVLALVLLLVERWVANRRKSNKED